ncbi:MAG: OmpH family outer membrane protein [Isosphaeraceae bacterium]
MVLSPRGVLAIGLSLAGITYLVAPTNGQAQPQQKADGGVRPAAANPNPAPAATPQPPVAPIFGTLDLDFVLKNYEKVKASSRELSAAVNVRRGELMKLESEARQEMEMMQKLQPGTADYKKREDHITELKARMEAGREQAQREFTLREAEMMSTIYKEIQGMTGSVARWRGMTYVLRATNPKKPTTGATDPNSVMAAMNDQVIYADPRNDITNDVVYYLNKTYEKTASPAGTTKPAARRAGAEGLAPSGN